MDYTAIARLIKSNFVPVILVICSTDAEEICQKNKQSVVQLLSKYSFSSQQAKGLETNSVDQIMNDLFFSSHNWRTTI
jgi:hypothetical protein